MKQSITSEQWFELGEEGCKKLGEWMIRKGYFKQTEKDGEILLEADWYSEELLPQPLGWITIGQMIEFLWDHFETHRNGQIEWDKNEGWYTHVGSQSFRDHELCNSLWEAVKNKLV